METGKIYFITAIIFKWIQILHNDDLNEIILSSLKHLVAEGAINLYAYVIMPNHIHLILKPLNDSDFKNIQLSLKRFTAQKIKILPDGQ
jgi:REP element-mobilizing transposase RayT